MNLKFVEAFYWACSLRSITRAAEKLHVTQSSLSNRISTLEDELGVKLLDRRSKQFRLTSAGQRFLTMSVKLLGMHREIKLAMGGVDDTPTVLRLGAVESVAHSWLSSWLRDVRQGNMNLELQLTIETSPVLMESIKKGALDIIFAAGAVPEKEFRTFALPPMQMCFVGDDSFSDSHAYELSDIAGSDLLTFQRGSQPHQELLQLFRQHGVESPRIHTISSISALVQLAEDGFGIATLPESVISRAKGRSRLTRLRSVATLAPLPLFVTYREDPASGHLDALFESLFVFLNLPNGPAEAVQSDAR
ncbi:LysR family transcriptional regulator [Ralstonia wenshanensis]|uniref:LysR family transcriptional regulator n=1 Tax=Ralstonia wenshanensis TaxID=2842456 RepID=UPI0039C64039